MNKSKNQPMKPLDLTSVLRDHEGEWVILSKDNSRVLFSGKTFDEIADHVMKGVVLLVGRFDAVYSPSDSA